MSLMGGWCSKNLDRDEVITEDACKAKYVTEYG